MRAETKSEAPTLDTDVDEFAPEPPNLAPAPSSVDALELDDEGDDIPDDEPEAAPITELRDRYSIVILDLPVNGLHDAMMTDSLLASDGYEMWRSADRRDVIVVHKGGGAFVLPWSRVRKSVPCIEDIAFFVKQASEARAAAQGSR